MSFITLQTKQAFKALAIFFSANILLACSTMPNTPSRQHIDINFEDALPSESFLPLPRQINGVTFDSTGPDYLPFIVDASKNYSVLGPRSQGVELTTVGKGYLSITLPNPKRMIWVSLIKTENRPLYYSLKNANGDIFFHGKFAFNDSDPLGAYRTFYLQYPDPHIAVSIVFNNGAGLGGNALLTRLVASDR